MRLLLVEEIEDGTAVVSGTVSHTDDGKGVPLKKVPSKKLLGNLFSKTDASINLLPPAVRWISPDSRIIVFERPPIIQRVDLAHQRREQINSTTTRSTLMIPVPWTVYIAYLDADNIPTIIGCYTRNGPIEDLDSTVGILPLPNFYYNGMLCNPSTSKVEGSDGSYAAALNMAYNAVWNSGFNLDLLDVYNLYTSTSGRWSKGSPLMRALSSADWNRDYKNWAELSLADVLASPLVPPSLTSTSSDNSEARTLDSMITMTYAIARGSSGGNVREATVKIVNHMT